MKKDKKLTIQQVFWYFLIFSIAGLFIEVLYGYATTGVIESRKGLIWGPFCPVYGVSGAVLIIFLHRFKDKNIFQLFIYGFLVGSIAEYILSYGLEMIYGIRFWDYGYADFDLNGRICLLYSFYWGILSVLIIKVIKPMIDKVINKIPLKIGNLVQIGIFIFLIIDCIFTVWGIQTYQNRVVDGKVNAEQTNNILIQLKQNIENNYFTNERMSKTFPNLRVRDKEGNEVWVTTLIKDENSK